jgi:transcription elongation GreA/GreB family factor
VWAAGAREAVPERVGVGTLVRLRYPDGSLDTVLVTAIPDEDVPSVTPDSPLGMALLGATVGEEVAWNAPQGRLRARVEHIAAGSMP